MLVLWMRRRIVEAEFERGAIIGFVTALRKPTAAKGIPSGLVFINGQFETAAIFQE